MDFLTFKDLFRAARDEALSRNPRLTQDAIDRDGSDANVLVASASAAADEVLGQLVLATASLFLDSAKETDLERLVFDRYGLTRKAAAPALGVVQFRTATANPAAFSILQGTLLSTADGNQFLTTDPAVVFPLGSVGPISVNVRSVLAGSSQQAAAGTITSIVGQIAGSPANLTVSNSAATAGADDAESDESLRDRARRFWTTVRRGTRAALVEGALAVQGVRSAAVFEAVDGVGLPGGSVELVVTDAYTDVLAQLAAVPPAYAAQAAALASAVMLGLDDVRALGVRVVVTVAQVILQNIQILLAFTAGADTAAVTAQAKAAVITYTNGLAPGQTWSRATAVARLRTVAGLVVSGSDVVLPAGDVVPNPLQVIRTSPTLVTPFTP